MLAAVVRDPRRRPKASTGRRQSSDGFLAVLGIILPVAAFANAEVSLVEMSAVTLCILTGLGAACLAAYLWHGRPPEERRFVSLGAVFCVYYAISYGFAVLGPAPPFSARVLRRGLDSLDLSAVPLGILAWLAGYRFLHLPAVSRAVRRLLLPERATRPVGPATLVAFYATTVIARVVLIGSGSGYGYLQDAQDVTTSASPVIQYAAEYGGFGIVIMGLTIVASGHASNNREGYRRAYRWMIGPEFLLGVLVGQKSEFLIVVVMFALAMRAAGRWSLSGGKLVLIAVVSLLVIFPLVGTYRDILRPETGRQLSAAEAPEALLTAVSETGAAFTAGPVAYVKYAFDQTVGRFREIDRAAVAIQTHDQGQPFSSPTEIPTRVATGVVPRVLWPGKPLDLYALEVSRDYYGLPRSVISASSLSPVGDAYRYGGIGMVAVVLALLGAYVRLLDEALRAKHSIWLVPLLIAAIPLLRSGDLAGLLVGAIRYYLIIGILYRFLFVRADGRARVASLAGRRSSGQAR